MKSEQTAVWSSCSSCSCSDICSSLPQLMCLWVITTLFHQSAGQGEDCRCLLLLLLLLNDMNPPGTAFNPQHIHLSGKHLKYYPWGPVWFWPIEPFVLDGDVQHLLQTWLKSCKILYYCKFRLRLLICTLSQYFSARGSITRFLIYSFKL